MYDVVNDNVGNIILDRARHNKCLLDLLATVTTVAGCVAQGNVQMVICMSANQLATEKLTAHKSSKILINFYNVEATAVKCAWRR